MNEYGIAHPDVLALVRPSTPTIDPVVDLMGRLVAESPVAASPEPQRAAVADDGNQIKPKPPVGNDVVYWLTPVKGSDDQGPEEVIRRLVEKEHIYEFGDNPPGRKRVKPGDFICFYGNGRGVMAHAKIESFPEQKPHKAVRDPERYPWVFRLTQPELYLNNPVVIDADLRSRLHEFQGRDPRKGWAWFVQGTGTVDEHDFRILTRTEAQAASTAP